MGSREELTLTGINDNGNKVKVRPELAGTPMPPEEFGLNGQLLRLFKQDNVLEGEAGSPAGRLGLQAGEPVVGKKRGEQLRKY